jgi:DNA primase
MDRNITEEIKAKLPVEEVVGSYVPLKKMGRIFKGLCPFHNEKTPSFTVNPDRGIYKCFGCGEGGDIFDFVIKVEGVTFPEALRLLADKANVELPEYKSDSKEPQGPGKSRLFSLNEYVTTFWHRILAEHPKAEHAREYLFGRGLLLESISEFRIGYAPYGSATGEALSKAGYTRAELQAAGEPTKFQDRIVFPIADLTGRVVGFTGRLLEHKDDLKNVSRGPKYWNSPETPLFVKSRTLFALHLAKHAMQEHGIAILAEGQMDVVMLHQAGFKHTVASSGTALTPDQLALIRRFVPAIAFAYDGDKAGKEATKRGLELALAADLTPYVIPIPHGKDPADCIQKDPASWQVAYDNRLVYMEWILKELLPNGVGELKTEERRLVAKDIAGWLARIQDPTEQAEWFRKAAAHLQTNEDNLRELYQRLYPHKPAAKSQEEAPKPVMQHQNNLYDIILALLFSFPEIHAAASSHIAGVSTAPVSEAFRSLQPLLQGEGTFEQRLNKHLNDQDRTQLNLASEATLQGYEGGDFNATWALSEILLIMRRIREQSHEQEKARIAAAIQQAQALGDTEKIKSLFAELQKLL